MSKTPEVASLEEAIPAPRSLWRNRDYLLLWSGQSLSAIGSSVSELAFPLLVLFLTHSPVQMGLASALRLLPYPVFNLLAGALVDRWDRKRVMLVCDVGRAICLASIPLAFTLGHLTVIQLYITALLEGTLVVFFGLAQTACLPQIVTREQLAHAVAQEEVKEGTTTLMGPALSGFLFTISQLLPFLADALSYVVSIVTLMFIRTSFQGQRVKQPQKLHRDISEGFSWMWHQPFIRSMTLLYSALAFASTGSAQQIILVLALQQHAPESVIGLIFTCGGIGAILGSLLAPHINRHLSIGQSIIGVRWSVALLWPLYAFMPNLFALGAIEFGLGLTDPIEDVAYFSYRYKLIPDELKGRVISATRQLPKMTRPLGAVLTGVLLQQLGVRQTVLIFWVIILFVSVLATLDSSIRKAGTEK